MKTLWMKGRSDSIFKQLLFAGCISLLIFSGASAATTSARSLSGHVPPAARNLKPLGRLPSVQQLDLAIGMPLRNREGLTNLLHDLYDPTSPSYRHFLTSKQFAERFGPTDTEYQALIAFAKANGLH